MRSPENANTDNPRVAFVEAALWHGSLDRAEAILSAHPEIASSDIHTAAVLGDHVAVDRLLSLDAANATLKAPPYGGDPLVYLCLSKYLRLDPARSAGFLYAARALLDAGADPNTGFWTTGERPEFESALYGAAGVAHHEELTRLLIERGAEPNDEEAVYHSPESYDLGAMKVLVETGRLTRENLALMLIRKHDWHDYEGAKYLLERGVDPNVDRWRGFRAIHHAVARDNHVRIIELLLDHGADPAVSQEGVSAVARAARRGRGDLLELFEQRGIPIDLDGADRLIAACARHDAAAVRSIAAAGPALVREVVERGGTLLAEFAGTGNSEGVRHLLDLGIHVNALYGGDGYFDIAKNSTALHVAAWRAWHDTVKVLIERGAEVNATDDRGRTPLALAVRACVDSYWAYRRAPDSVRALLDAGATTDGFPYPSGYAEVDALLRTKGKL